MGIEPNSEPRKNDVPQINEALESGPNASPNVNERPVAEDDNPLAGASISASASIEPEIEVANAAPSRGYNPRAYKDPTPSSWLIHSMGLVNDWVVLHGLPLIRSIPVLNEIPMVRGLLKISKVDFPDDDLQRLKSHVNKDTAAFLAPNHPEFFSDWMVDKKVSMAVSPLMAHWADWTIVNGKRMFQGFWLKNNLIANVPGGGGKDFSAYWAEKGHGVLLHPEGHVGWTNNKVQKLFPGVGDMAADLARSLRAKESERPVYVVSFVSKFHFDRDVSSALGREIDLIERKLKLPSSRAESRLEQRFFSLQKNILEHSEQKYEIAENNGPITPQNFFARQQALHTELVRRLEVRYGHKADEPARNLHLLSRAIKEDKSATREERKEYRKYVDEAMRLSGFVADVYATPTLSQEQIAESLKRIRQERVNANIFDMLARFVPIPVGPRTIHLRVPEPIDVSKLVAASDTPDLGETIVKTLRTRMQSTLDEINQEIAPAVSKFARPNPFARAG